MKFKIFITILSCFSLFVYLQFFQKTDHHESIPEKVIKEYLKTNEFQIKELKGGLSATLLYKVDTKTDSYVLRMHQSEILGDQDSLELYALIEGAKAGISPKVLYVSSDKRAVLMEYINQKTVSIEQATLDENIVKIANAIKVAHQMKGHKISGETLLSKAERTYKKVIRDQLAPEAEITEALHLIKDYSQALSLHEYPKVHNHGDLNPRNIFISDRVVFIDWAETTLTDPFSDLSYLSLNMDYTPSQEELLLITYLNRDPTPKEWERYELQKKIHHAFWSLTDLYLADAELKKHPEQILDKNHPLENWQTYRKNFANGSELTAQYFYDRSRLNYQFAL